MGRINWNSRGRNGTWEKSRHFRDLFATSGRTGFDAESAQPVEGRKAKSPLKIVSFWADLGYVLQLSCFGRHEDGLHKLHAANPQFHWSAWDGMSPR